MSKDIDRFVAWIFQLHLQKFVAFCCTRPTTVSTTLLVSMPGSFHCTCRSSSSFGSPWTSSWPWNGGVKGPGTSSWPWKGGFEHPVTSSWPWNGGSEETIAKKHEESKINCRARGGRKQLQKNRKKAKTIAGRGGGEETTTKKQKESKINCRARGRGGNNRQKMEEGKTSCQGHNCTQKPGQVKITNKGRNRRP